MLKKKDRRADDTAEGCGLIACVCAVLGGRPAPAAAQETPRLHIGQWSVQYDTKALTVFSIEESKPPNSFTPFTITLRNDSGRIVTAFCLSADEDRECRTQDHFKPAVTATKGIRAAEPPTLRMSAVLFGDGVAAGDGDPADVEWMRFQMPGVTLETGRCAAILRKVESGKLDDATLEALITSIDQPYSPFERAMASLPPSPLKEKVAGADMRARSPFVFGVGLARGQILDSLKAVAKVPIVSSGPDAQTRVAEFSQFLNSTEQQSEAYLATCKVDMGVE